MTIGWPRLALPRRILTALTLYVGTLSGYGAESAAGIHLTAFADDQLPQLRQFVDDVLGTIRRYAPPARLPPKLEFTGHAPLARDRAEVYYLPPEPAQRRQRVIRVFWLHHFRQYTGHVTEETVPDWLVAATDWLAGQPLDVTPVARLRYPYTAYYLQHNQLPDPLHLAKHPVPAAEYSFYPLYAESCAVAFLAFVGRDDVAMTNLMRLYDDRRPAELNIKHLMPAFVRDDLRRRQWYRQHVIKLIAGSESLLSIAESDTLRQQYETISAAPAGVLESSAHRIPLDEIHLAMPKWRMDRRVVVNLQRRFLELRQRSHPVLRPAIQQYVAAIPRFQAADSTAAIKQLAAARRAFKDAMLQARQYEARLDAVEATTTAGTATYLSPFPMVEAATPAPGPASKRIEAVLDQFERPTDR